MWTTMIDTCKGWWQASSLPAAAVEVVIVGADHTFQFILYGCNSGLWYIQGHYDQSMSLEVVYSALSRCLMCNYAW